MSMALDSLYQKRLLQSLHPNVHVIRHGKLLWSHHESACQVGRGVREPVRCGGEGGSA